jgi:hypothetical protein
MNVSSCAQRRRRIGVLRWLAQHRITAMMPAKFEATIWQRRLRQSNQRGAEKI